MPTVRTNLANEGNKYILVNGTSITPGVSYLGSTWERLTSIATDVGVVRQDVILSRLKQGVKYQCEVEVANDTASAINIQLDWCDAGLASYSVAPGERKRVSTVPSLSVMGEYNATYKFFDLQIDTLSSSVLFRQTLIEEESIKGPYFDGGAPNENGKVHEWLGAAGSSASTETVYSIQTRKNFSKNPRCEFDSYNWAFVGPGSLTGYGQFQKSVGGPTAQIPTYVHGEYTGGVAGSSTFGFYTGSINISPGKPYAIRRWGRFSKATAARVTIDWNNGPYLFTSTSDLVNFPANTWVEVTFLITAPANATGAAVCLYSLPADNAGLTWASTDWADGTGELVEISPVLKPYFDGSMSQTLYKKYAWEGIKGQTPSVEYSILDFPADNLSLGDLEYDYWKATSGLSSGSLSDVMRKGLEIKTGLSNLSVSDLELRYWKSLSGLAAGTIQDHFMAVANRNPKAYYAGFFK